MRYRITSISTSLKVTEKELRNLAASKLRLPEKKIGTVEIAKQSVDARKKNDIRFQFTLEAEIEGELQRPLPPGVTIAVPYVYLPPKAPRLSCRPVVVGGGPAGLFAALILAQAGQRPLLLERGKDVDARQEDVERFWKTGALNTASNVQFGEGGAGTFSDGKLNTGTKDIRARKVLEEFVAAGAPPEILYQAKPHIGTDKLRGVVKNLRKAIQALGGEVRFEHTVSGFIEKEGRLKAVRVKDGSGQESEWAAEEVILAVGHSARDTFAWLFKAGIALSSKPFSVGVRIEHLQERIDQGQYGSFAGHPALGPADYKLAVHLKNGRGVYTFCMCPGGKVVAAASEENGVVTNGMSEFARDQCNANSALLVGVDASDFQEDHPLAGVAFQRKLEQAAFALGGGGYRAPAQRLEDFLKGKASSGFGEVRPSYQPGVVPCDLSTLFSSEITESLRQGAIAMGQRLQGFSAPDAVLTGVESRSSSPVRMVRGDDCQSITLKGLYPCGEGAGYAGGIISAAVDGIRCAEALLHSAV